MLHFSKLDVRTLIFPKITPLQVRFKGRHRDTVRATHFSEGTHFRWISISGFDERSIFTVIWSVFSDLYNYITTDFIMFMARRHKHIVVCSYAVPFSHVVPLTYEVRDIVTLKTLKGQWISLCSRRGIKQEAQLMLTNSRDAFRGQSRSPNSSIPYVRHSFVLCNSNFVFTTVDFKKCRDLEIWVRGHSRSLKEVPFYTPGMVSY